MQASSKAYPSAAVAVLPQPMQEGAQEGRGEFKNGGKAYRFFPISRTRELPSVQYPPEDRNFQRMIAAQSMGAISGGSDFIRGTSAIVNGAVAGYTPPSLPPGSNDRRGRVHQAFRLGSSTPYVLSSSLPHDTGAAGPVSGVIGAADAVSAFEGRSLDGGIAEGQGLSGGRAVTPKLDLPPLKGGQQQHPGVVQAKAGRRLSNSPRHERQKKVPVKSGEGDMWRAR